MKRLDTAEKLNGRLVYAIDVKLPGMLCAAIKDCPVFGGKLVSFDESKIAGRARCSGARSRSTTRRSPSSPTRGGTRRRRSTRCPSSGTRDRTRRARARRSPTHLQEGLAAPDAYAMRQEGDAPKAIAGAAKKVEAVYGTPFLAHATMEPMNCTARITAGPRRSVGADAERRGVARGAVRGVGPAARQVRGLQAHRSAAASAGAAARRTTCGRRWRSPSSFPAFRSR